LNYTREKWCLIYHYWGNSSMPRIARFFILKTEVETSFSLDSSFRRRPESSL